MPTAENNSTMTLADALAALGVNDETLSADELASIDRNGYIVFPSLLTREKASSLAAKLDEIADAEGEKAGTDFHTEPGTTRLGNLMNKCADFDICFTHPKILAAVNHITRGDFGVSSLTARAAMAGEGAQPMHVDFAHETTPGVWIPTQNISANVLFACDDFTEANGATRLIPGSNKYGKAPGDVCDASAPHPDQILLEIPAGSVAIIDGATWHGGTRNTTDKARHLISVMCQPRGKYQDWAYRKISRETASRLSDAAKVVLDHTIE